MTTHPYRLTQDIQPAGHAQPIPSGTEIAALEVLVENVAPNIVLDAIASGKAVESSGDTETGEGDG